MSNKLKWGLGLGALVLIAGVYHYFYPGYCRSAKSKYGLELKRCPEGKLLQLANVSAQGLSRKGAGTVSVGARAVYTESKPEQERSATLGKFKVALTLVAADGTETALQPQPLKEADRQKGKKGKWRWDGQRLAARIELPEVPDGDYKLRAQVKSQVGENTVDVPLGLYAPAKIHVITDRPLYEPGNVVKFRALALRAGDLTPIDQRPGKWEVRDPSGVVLLDEKVAAADWGVASGSFPIDSGASSGAWTVKWVSGSDSGAQSFTVKPFTLPRFRVEAGASRPFYRAGESPVLEGEVVYSSGAPVIGARISVRWQSQGSWPPPPQWLATELPKVIEVGRDGRFRAELPKVPDDLRAQTSLVAYMSATDPAGDRVSSSARILLSDDPIQAEALTELAGGLVQGSNNRLYLRVTTADGRPLSGKSINVKRGWEPTDKGIDASLDLDSVARVQVDPGPPVNVVVPPMPVRATTRAGGPLVTRIAARDVVSDQDASLADRRAMDSWTKPLEPCAKWVSGSDDASVGVRVASSGQVSAVVASSGELSKCVAKTLRARRLPSGAARIYTISYRFSDPRLPTLDIESAGALDASSGVDDLLETISTDARTCVGKNSPEEFGDGIAWQIGQGDKKPTATWIRVSSESAMPNATKACVMAAFKRHELEEPAPGADLGVARFSVTFPVGEKVVKPQPTIMKGYELAVSMKLDDGTLAKTIVRMKPGAIPAIRMRATPVVASSGDTIEIAVLRGPQFKGKLPKKIRVRHLETSKQIDLGKEDRIARFVVPADAKGWYVFDGVENATTRVYVRSKAELEVAIAPEKSQYRPGDSATLTIDTKVGGQGTAAAVGLFGVDSSLAQLTPLPGADALSGLRPPIEMSGGKAFGVLDAQALTVGRIRGTNAAEATVLRVSRVPQPADLDNLVSGHGETSFDSVAVLTDRFYPILAQLHRQTREWERSAPAGEEMSNKTLAGLWKKALAAVKASGGDVLDIYGRELRLHRLPTDLLGLTAPQQVVVVGTRLPEDFENWAAWVAKETP